MNVPTIDLVMAATPLKPQAFQPLSKTQNKEVATPKHYCCTCKNRHGNHCDCFERRIEPSENKCFNHTDYTHGNKVKYQTPAGLVSEVNRRDALRQADIYPCELTILSHIPSQV